MDHALNALTTFAFVEETTENTTPATPAFQIFRALGEDTNVERSHSFGGELDGRHGQKTFARNSGMGSGTVDFEFSDGLLEEILESVLRGEWSTDVLVNGSTAKSFTFETKFEAGATDLFKRFTGAQINTLSLSLQAAERVTGSFGFMSRGAAFANAIVTGATYTEGSAEAIEVGASVGNVTLSGITLGCVPSIELNINANLAAEYGLGNLGPCFLPPGELEISAAVQAHVSADQYALLQAYEAGTATGLSFDIGATAGKILEVSMPNGRLDGLQAASRSRDGSLVASFTFRALQASALSGGVIELTRNA